MHKQHASSTIFACLCTCRPVISHTTITMATSRPHRKSTKPPSNVPYINSDSISFTPPHVNDLTQEEMSDIGDQGSVYEKAAAAPAASAPSARAASSSEANIDDVVRADEMLGDDQKQHEPQEAKESREKKRTRSAAGPAAAPKEDKAKKARLSKWTHAEDLELCQAVLKFVNDNRGQLHHQFERRLVRSQLRHGLRSRRTLRRREAKMIQ